jgi:SSS family solute:Na+ symporter
MAGAFFAFAFGSIPQQDVFQRMTSAKDEKTAVRGTIIGGLVYFCFAFVPIFIAYAALVTTPSWPSCSVGEDARVPSSASCPTWCWARCRCGRR